MPRKDKKGNEAGESPKGKGKLPVEKKEVDPQKYQQVIYGRILTRF